MNAAAPSPSPDRPHKPLYRRPLLVAAVLAVLLLVLLAGVVHWRRSSHHLTTDDAFIDGRSSRIAAQAAGRITAVKVRDNQHVQAGEVLLEIDPRDAQAQWTQARAQVATAVGKVQTARAQVAMRRAAQAQAAAALQQAQAHADQALQDLARFEQVDRQAVARQQIDAARAASRSAQAERLAAQGQVRLAAAQVEAALADEQAAIAQRQAAEAAEEAARLQRSYYQVVAPVAGRVAERRVEVGNVVALGQPLLALVGDELWVTANYKETQLKNMRPGLPAILHVDAFPDVEFQGRVDSIQRGTGSFFSALPAENATGNYVKVVQRVPVKIVFTDRRVQDYPIGPGLSVQPDVRLP